MELQLTTPIPLNREILIELFDGKKSRKPKQINFIGKGLYNYIGSKKIKESQIIILEYPSKVRS